MADSEPSQSGIDAIVTGDPESAGPPSTPETPAPSHPQPAPGTMAPADTPPATAGIASSGETEASAVPEAHPRATVSIADGALRHLDARYVELSRTIGMVVTLVIAAGGLIGGVAIPAISGAPAWAVALLAIGIGAVTVMAGYLFHRWPVIEHPYHSYRVNPLGIEIHDGVWFRSVVNVARSRIQHTDVSQGPIERRFGLATLHIHTAGTEQAEVTLPGLEHATALAIRDYLVAGGADDAV